MNDHELAAALAAEAGALLLKIRDQGGAAGDRQSNELLLRRLAEERPGEAVLSEESTDHPGRLARERVWIIDPLDGTREYGEPPREDWAVHVALAVGGRAVVGAVALPAAGLVLSTGQPPALAPRASGLNAGEQSAPAAVPGLPTGEPLEVTPREPGLVLGTGEPPALAPRAAPASAVPGLALGTSQPSAPAPRVAGARTREVPGVPGVRAAGAAGAPAPGAPEPIRLAVSRTRPPACVDVLTERLGVALVPMGSAGAKAMAVVRGQVDVYAHSGGQYEWDSCAPAAVAAAAGLHVSRLDGGPLRYNRPDPYLPDLLICRPELADTILRSLT